MTAIDNIVPFLGQGVTIIKFDKNGLIALCKPVDVISHPNSPKPDKYALFTTSYDNANRRYNLPNGYHVYLLNRLDSPTSGVLLCATNSDTAIAVRNAFNYNHVRKTYLALCKGFATKTSGRWNDKISKIHNNNQLRIKKGSDLLSKTKYKVISTDDKLSVKVSLLELEPITGRTHQLRWQCSQHHLPIIGDKTYGDFQFNRAFSKTTNTKRLMLHSQSISLDYQMRSEKFTFEASTTSNLFDI